MVRLRGTIVASTPRESPRALGNSRARNYFEERKDTPLYTIYNDGTSYGVDADPGTDTFIVRVTNAASSGPWRYGSVRQYELRLKVTPSPGMRYTAAPSDGSTTFHAATGIWDIGTLEGGGGNEPAGNKQLNIRVPGRGNLAIPPEDQCLTVEIEHVAPDPSVSWLPVTACMSHKALVTQGHGDFGIFSWYDCLAGSDYPCDGQPSLELAAVKSAHQPDSSYIVQEVHRARFRSDEFEYRYDNNMILQPEEAVLQVEDSGVTRVMESGNTMWSTIDIFDLYIVQREFDSTWSGFKESVTVSGVDGAASPGRWRMGLRDDSFVFLDAIDSTKVEGEPYNYDLIPSDGLTDFKIDFGALGTYVALFEIEGTKSGTPYTDSGTYTFHVGPVAELEVRDDPDYSLVEPGERAYTIVARNQGPDTAPAVRVRLTGVPEDAEAVTSQGSYAQGACQDGLCEGVWSIGEMSPVAARYAEGRNEEEVLTIIPTGSGGPITAAIENTRDYSVVIDGTTHSTNYYDYLDHNNEAEVALRGASSIRLQGRPERPTVTRVPTVAGLPSFALVQWQPLEWLNGFRVTHYEVQGLSSHLTWETLDGDVGGTVYLDMQGRSASAAYRVRAVNEGGGHGPWSLASRQGPGTPRAPGNLRAVANGPDEIRLTWSRPSGLRGELEYYELERAWEDPDLPGQRLWAPLAQVKPEDGTAYVDAGLQLESTFHYRVRAVVWDGRELIEGAWSLSASAATGRAAEGTGELWDLSAEALGENSIRLTWRAPDEGRGLRYRIDHASATDPDNWETLRSSHTGTCTVDGETLQCYTHGGLLSGTEHHYRVAIVQGGAFGPWAHFLPVTTQGAETTVPGIPENLRLTSLGRASATIAWDPPARDGGTRITGYEYQVFGPCLNPGPDETADYCQVVPPTRTSSTSRTISGLNVLGTYWFQVRALNAVGAGSWDTPGVVAEVDPQSRGRIVLSPSNLTVTEGGTATYRVKLSSNPTYPVRLMLLWEDWDSWEGDADGNGNLAAQQRQVLMPSGYRVPEGETWYAWNVGIPITVAALDDLDEEDETGLIVHDIYTLTCAELNDAPASCQADPKTDPEDPVYHGLYGTTLKVTERDTGSNGPTGNTGVVGGSAPGDGNAQPAAVTLALDAASVSESAGQVTLTATLDAPAPEGGIGGFLFAGADGTASQDIDFTMPLGIFVPGGQRSATAAISITGDDLDEEDETVALSVLFDIGTALLEDQITLTITDDDTAGVTVSAASGLAVDEGGTATYTVVLDSQPTADVTVIPYNADTDAVAVSPASYTFTPSDWHTPLTFTVSGLADDDRDDESVEIIHWLTGDDWKYAVVPVAKVSVSVSDTTPEQQGPPNQPPTVSSAIGDATIVSESGTHSVSLSGVFSDPDNDSLTITAASSDGAKATVSVSADYSSLTVKAQARGTATITVTANDGRGGTVSDAFTVMVKAAPVVASAIADVSGMEIGDSQDIALSGVFSDADGDSLTFTADPSDFAVANAFLHQGTLTVFAVGEGTATITVTARDSDGNTVSDAFEVAVEPEQDPPPDEETPDGTPTVAQPLPDISLEGLQWRQFSLPGVFHDPDGDELTFTVVSSDYGVATAWVAGSTLTVVATSTGTATITVTAEDHEGNRVSDAFQVTVTPAS